jgi:hypothetical protein
MNRIRDKAQKRNVYLRLVSTSHIAVVVISLLAGVCMLSACGNTSMPATATGPLSGNWQFQLTTDGSFGSPVSPNCLPAQGAASAPFCVSGFLVQTNGAVSGQLQYSIILPSQAGTFCNGGSATVTGTVSGQNVALTALAGPETFTLNGTLSSDGSTMMGTYTSDSQGCGNAQTGSAWVATSVPSLSGVVQGRFHSTGAGSDTAFANQDFPVTGSLIQGPNTGATSVSVTGTLNFQGYPCLDKASVNGQISGGSVILQIIAVNGVVVGQIGAPPGFLNPGPVTVSNSAGGHLLLGSNGYGLTTTSCKGGNVKGDIGNICLGLGSTTSCSQPITVSPASLNFPAQLLGSTPTSQSFMIANTDPSSATLSLQLTFPGVGSTPSDFDGIPHFAEQDNCTTSPGSSFSLAPQQACTVTISFSPQESCPWLPSVSIGGAAPSQCPPFLPVLPASVGSPPVLIAPLMVSCLTCSTSLDGNTTFAAPVLGIGLSAIQPSTPELDFGAENAPTQSGAGGEVSLPQSLSFVNTGTAPVQILPATNPVCGLSPGRSTVQLPRPATPGTLPGFQVVTGGATTTLVTNPPSPNTVQYICDVDQTTHRPDFQITLDDCSGAFLAPQQSCSIRVIYAPQANQANGGLDYFLELNSLECTGAITTNCEIDSGRFPVELKSNVSSPLRMAPGAGLDFGLQPQGQTSLPLTITLTNDEHVANPGPVNFGGNVVKGDFAETDDCGSSLAPGATCTLSITFSPGSTGFQQGSMTITYNNAQGAGQTQTVYMRGFGF